MKRTGYFECSNEKVNKLFQNIIWGQKGNFLDIPTDCPQRDERCGWTGDAQIFIRAATYNFDVKKFFGKWLADLAADQFEDGGVPAIVPNTIGEMHANSAAFADAAVICPWQIYLTYGEPDVLIAQFDSMRKWVDYVRGEAGDRYLWIGGEHYGDWLALDGGEGKTGATPKDYIATAYFANSTGLLIKAGKALGKDMSEYEDVYANIVRAFQKEYIKGGKISVGTQTAHALALYFGLCGENGAQSAASLAGMVAASGNKLSTGFLGTSCLLHALSQYGYADVAYSLLLREEFPSWLYSVIKGATTVWEHWDGIKEDDSFWDENMNSFNHYAYGAVADWMYGVVAGINTDEKAPGFENALLKPIPDKRLGYALASIDTKFGKLSSKWSIEGDTVTYEFEVPNKASIVTGEDEYRVEKGKHCYTGKLKKAD
jgi:alpha-L-rhamnosidase